MRKRRLILTIALAAVTAAVRADIINGPDDGQSQRKTEHTVAVGGSVSWITSKVYNSYHSYDRWIAGPGVDIEYNFVSKNGFGAGAAFFYNSTHIAGTSVQTWYAGPLVAYRLRMGSWQMGADLGLGYSNCDLEGHDEKGMAMKSDVNVEYRISSHFGIMAQMGGLTTFFGGTNDYGKDEELNGISYWGLSIGICVHL